MPEIITTPVDETPVQQVETPEQTSEPAAEEATEGTEAPPWGSDEDFNPESAWKLIQNLRGDKAKLQEKLSAQAGKAASEEEEPSEPEPEPEESKAESEPTVDQLKAEKQALQTELTKMRALHANGLPEEMAEFLPNGSDEEIGLAVEKLLKFRGAGTPAAGQPLPPNPAQAAGQNPPAPSKDDLAREAFAAAGLS
ncbi:MAG: hypothetical protein Q4A03_02525 [Rothia sp. (in: high G+C Gram-positive bacteria)]|uniref:hypothetical protein n=1 Tax=Rothia sp. (in: high G+C Gram-positive bacteria) TaxID=1885016 RepID=UPI002708DA47|nr:hypothetical protein [Rothia sp. (in: high G+C Gram-positive bacteria)]